MNKPLTNSPAPDDRTSRLANSIAVGYLAFILVALVAILLVGLVANNDDKERGRSTRQCPGYAVGTVDPGTCQPYGPAGAPPAGTSHAGSNPGTVRKPAAQPKAPAVKAPAAPAVKAPAPPPVRLTK